LNILNSQFVVFILILKAPAKPMALHVAQGKGDSSEIDDLTEEWRARLWPGGWNPHDPPAEPVDLTCHR